MRSMRRLAFALATCIVAVGACSLGITESEVQHGRGGGGGGTAGSSATMAPPTVCGDHVCDTEGGEACGNCPEDCPCFQGDACGDEGVCVTCKAEFATKIPGAPKATPGLAASDGRLYLAPTTTANAELVAVNSCNGTITEASLAGPSMAPSVGGAVAPGNSATRLIVAAGYAPSATNQGNLVVGFDDALKITWQHHDDPTSQIDTLAGIAAAGDVWMAVGTRVASPQSWIMSGDLAGKHFCSDSSQLNGADGAAMASDGTSTLYAAGNGGDGGIYVSSFPAGMCTPCPCRPQIQLGPLHVGSMGTTVSAMLFANGALYLAGSATDDGTHIQAFLEQISPMTGDTIGTVFMQPSSGDLDAFVALAADDNFIYAGGYSGKNSADPTKGTPLLLGFTRDLATPPFDAHPSSGIAVVGVAVVKQLPDSGDKLLASSVFASIDDGDGVTVIRCAAEKDGCK
jgi:hypothetical protein